MIVFDYILLGAILIIGLLGWKKGFLESLGSILGIVIATFIASRYYPEVSSWFGNTNFANVAAFLVIFGVAIKFVSLLFWVLGKIFKIITVLPFISSLDRLLGLILGLVEGIFIVAIVLYFVLKYPMNDWVIVQMNSSVVAKVLLKIAFIFVPLFPEAFKKIKSAI